MLYAPGGPGCPPSRVASIARLRANGVAQPEEVAIIQSMELALQPTFATWDFLLCVVPSGDLVPLVTALVTSVFERRATRGFRKSTGGQGCHQEHQITP